MRFSPNMCTPHKDFCWGWGLSERVCGCNPGTKQLGPGGQVRQALQLSLSVGKTNLLLRNLLRTPILELEAANINVGKHIW